MWETLHGVAAILLALFGYSAGAAGSARRGMAVPQAFDLVAAPAVAMAVLVVGAEPLGWLLLPSAAVGSTVPGAAVALLRRHPSGEVAGRPPRDGAGRSGHEEDSRFPRVSRFLHRTGEFQGRLILGLFYFGILAPFALIARLVQDPLDGSGKAPMWLVREGEHEDALESHGRPY